MATLRVALLQLLSQGGNVAHNREQGVAACREAVARGADLALVLELWSVGYERGFDPALAEPRDGPFVSAIASLARELGIAIGITYLERTEGAPRNALALALSGAEGILVPNACPLRDDPDGSTILLAGSGEEIAIAEIDLDRVRAFRCQEEGRTLARRPALYAAIARR